MLWRRWSTSPGWAARGIRELGELLVRRTAYARERLAAVDGIELLHDAPVAREFAVRLGAPVDRVLDRCAERGIAAGYPLGRDYPEHEDGLLVAITERRSRAQIDSLAEAIADAIAEPAPPTSSASARGEGIRDGSRSLPRSEAGRVRWRPRAVIAGSRKTF